MVFPAIHPLLEPVRHSRFNPAYSVRTDLHPLREQPSLIQSSYMLR